MLVSEPASQSTIDWPLALDWHPGTGASHAGGGPRRSCRRPGCFRDDHLAQHAQLLEHRGYVGVVLLGALYRVALYRVALYRRTLGDEFSSPLLDGGGEDLEDMRKIIDQGRLGDAVDIVEPSAHPGGPFVQNGIASLAKTPRQVLRALVIGIAGLTICYHLLTACYA